MQVKKQQLERDMEQSAGSKLGKEYVKDVYYHPVYLTRAEFIRQNVRLDEAQAGIKIVGKNISNLRYSDDNTFTAESEEELMSLLIKVKEESENVDLKLSIQKLRSRHLVHHFMANRWGDSGNSDGLYFGGSKITADGDCSHEIKRCLLLGRKVMINLDRTLNSRDITLSTKFCLIKAMFFPRVM